MDIIRKILATATAVLLLAGGSARTQQPIEFNYGINEPIPRVKIQAAIEPAYLLQYLKQTRK